jgi:hypothetical protein
MDPFHGLYQWKIIQTFDNPCEFSKEAPELVVNQPTIFVRLEKNSKEPSDSKTIYN